MSQLSLFDSKKPAPEPNSGVSSEFIRKELLRVVRIVKAAEFMPWSDYEMRKWEGYFQELAPRIPDGEGERLHEAFLKELVRLRASTKP